VHYEKEIRKKVQCWGVKDMIMDIFESAAIGNLITMSGIVIAAAVGLSIYKKQKEQYLEKLCNFIPQMKRHLSHLEKLTANRLSSDMKWKHLSTTHTIDFNPTFFVLSKSANYLSDSFDAKSDKNLMKEMENLGKFSGEFLHFLRNASSQISEISYRRKAFESAKIDELSEYLFALELLGKGILVNDLPFSSYMESSYDSSNGMTTKEEKKLKLIESVREYVTELRTTIAELQKFYDDTEKAFIKKTLR
jgi:hypothetical protein